MRCYITRWRIVISVTKKSLTSSLDMHAARANNSGSRGGARSLLRGHPQQTATAMLMLLSRPPWWVCGGDTDARHLPISTSSSIRSVFGHRNVLCGTIGKVSAWSFDRHIGSDETRELGGAVAVSV